MTDRTRPLRLEDAEELAARLAGARAFMAPYEPIRPEAFHTAAGQREVLAGRLRRREEGREEPLAILDDDGRIVGGIALQPIERGPYLSRGFGHWVAPEANGRGYASAAVGEALALAFAGLGLHRVQAVTLRTTSARSGCSPSTGSR